MTKKKPLSGDLLAECQAAHALFLKKKHELNLSQKKIADAAGISAPAVNLYFKGTNALNLQFAMVLSRLLDEPIEKFSERLARQRLQITNEDRDSSSRPEVDSNAYYIGPIDAWDDETPVADDEVAVPFLKEVELSAGSGRTVIEQSSTAKLRFGKQTLRNHSVQFDQAVCVCVHGNSMEPVMPHGSTVAVNRGETQIIDGKIYALNHDGQLRVKLLYRLPGGGIRMRSYNREEHQDEDFTAAQQQEAHISLIGRVFWGAAFF